MAKLLSNFIIGFFAGVCAVFVPRMASMLSGSENIEVFHKDYLILGTAFAVIIGVVTAIFLQTSKKRPSEIFMTALGIPALLSGALNTGTTAGEMHDIEAQKQKLIAALGDKSGIPIQEDAAPLVPLKSAPHGRHSPTSQLELSLIASAHAEDTTDIEDDSSLHLGIRPERKTYLIVLLKLDAPDAASQRADAIRKAIPTAEVMRSGNAYLIVESTKPRSKADAILRAVEVKKQFEARFDLKPYLVPAR